MSDEILYRKVMKGQRTTYESVTDGPGPVLTYTEEQCLTVAGALGTVLLTIFERNIPPHSRIARKINNVQAAILDLYAGTGAHIDDGLAEQVFQTWDRTMKEIAGVMPCH